MDSKTCSSFQHNVQSQYAPSYNVVRLIVTLVAHYMDMSSLLVQWVILLPGLQAD